MPPKARHVWYTTIGSTIRTYMCISPDIHPQRECAVDGQCCAGCVRQTIRYPLCTSADRLSAAAHQLISFSSHLFIIGQQQAASGAVSVHFGGWCMRTVRFTVLLLALMVDGRRDSPHTCLSYGQRLHDAVLVVGAAQHTICHCLDLVHRVRHGAAHARQLQHLNVVLTVARSHDV